MSDAEKETPKGYGTTDSKTAEPVFKGKMQKCVSLLPIKPFLFVKFYYFFFYAAQGSLVPAYLVMFREHGLTAPNITLILGLRSIVGFVLYIVL